jgi:hypothetical protein
MGKMERDEELNIDICPHCKGDFSYLKQGKITHCPLCERKIYFTGSIKYGGPWSRTNPLIYWIIVIIGFIFVAGIFIAKPELMFKLSKFMSQ